MSGVPLDTYRELARQCRIYRSRTERGLCKLHPDNLDALCDAAERGVSHERVQELRDAIAELVDATNSRAGEPRPQPRWQTQNRCRIAQGAVDRLLAQLCGEPERK